MEERFTRGAVRKANVRVFKVDRQSVERLKQDVGDNVSPCEQRVAKVATILTEGGQEEPTEEAKTVPWLVQLGCMSILFVELFVLTFWSPRIRERWCSFSRHMVTSSSATV